LNADDLVVGGENIFAPETRVKMFMMALMAVVVVAVVALRFTIWRKLAD
jgi:hypothetical protein